MRSRRRNRLSVTAAAAGSRAAGVETLEARVLLSAPAQGLEFHVNTFTPNYQTLPRVAMSAGGSFVVVWSSTNQVSAASGQDVYAQRYTAAGAPAGGEFLVNTTTAGEQQWASVAMDDTGDFVVAWQSADGNGTGIFAQRYNAAGAAQGGEFRANTTIAGSQELPAVAMDADGDFVVAWDTYNAGNNPPTDVSAQRYNSAGVAQGGEIAVNAYTTGEQYNPAVAMDDAGDFVIVWSDGTRDGSAYGIYGRRFNSAGAAQGADFSVNTYTTSDQIFPSIAMDADGDFVVAWQSYYQDTHFEGIYGQRFNALAAKLGAEFRANTFVPFGQAGPSAAMDSAGNFVIAWESFGQDGSGNGVYAQAYDASGAPSGGEFRANTYTTNDQDFTAVAMDADGDFVIAWQSRYQEGPANPPPNPRHGIYAQRFKLDATPPSVSASDFHYQTAPHALRFTFSENVSASLSAADVSVVTVPGGTAVPLQLLGYDTGTNTATFVFPATPAGVLPDGRYRATINAAGITDAAGNALAPVAPLDFFFLTADANHDATVNLQDFNILAGNFGQSGRDFSQGDFNYDGTVNLSDFNLLAGKFGTGLSPQTFGAVRIGPAGRSGASTDSLRDDVLM